MSSIAFLLFLPAKTHLMIAKGRSRARFCLVFQLRFYVIHHKPGLTKFAIRHEECILDRLAIYELRNAPGVNILEQPTIRPRRRVKINSSNLSHNRHLPSSTTWAYRNPHHQWLVTSPRGPAARGNRPIFSRQNLVQLTKAILAAAKRTQCLCHLTCSLPSK